MADNSKVYFLRIAMTVSPMTVALVNFFISFILVAILMGFYGFVPSGKIVYMPLFFAPCFNYFSGSTLLITTLNVRYRDFRYIFPFIIQFGPYVSRLDLVAKTYPASGELLYSINCNE